MKKSDKINDRKWPRDIRSKVNELVDKSNRAIVARYDDGIGGPEVQDTDNQISILIPRPTSGNGLTVSIVVCIDDGAGGYTQALANFENGILISIT